MAKINRLIILTALLLIIPAVVSSQHRPGMTKPGYLIAMKLVDLEVALALEKSGSTEAVEKMIDQGQVIRLDRRERVWILDNQKPDKIYIKQPGYTIGFWTIFDAVELDY